MKTKIGLPTLIVLQLPQTYKFYIVLKIFRKMLCTSQIQLAALLLPVANHSNSWGVTIYSCFVQ